MTSVAPIHSLINQNQQAGGLNNVLRELRDAEASCQPLTEAQRLLKNRIDANAALRSANGSTLDVFNKAGNVVRQQTYIPDTLGEIKGLSKNAKIGIGVAIAAALGIGGYLVKTKAADKKAQAGKQPKKLDMAA